MNSPLSWNRKGKRQKASPLFVNEKTMRSRWEFPPMAGFGSDLHTSVMGNPNIFQEYVRNLIWMQCITCYPMHWKHQCIEPFVNTSSIVEGSQAKTNPRHELLQPGGTLVAENIYLYQLQVNVSISNWSMKLSDGKGGEEFYRKWANCQGGKFGSLLVARWWGGLEDLLLLVLMSRARVGSRCLALCKYWWNYASFWPGLRGVKIYTKQMHL